MKYQKEWEEKFTIVHYDQRGCGKSYQFFKDYSDVSAKTHVEDLIALTEYTTEYLGQKQVILVGHSYGTYIAMNAAYQRPELYRAYVGIGQVANKAEAELDNLNKYISAAEEYLDDLTCHQGKEYILFEDSAHFPQFEEKQRFYLWMKETFGE